MPYAPYARSAPCSELQVEAEDSINNPGTSSIVSPSYPFLPHLHLLSSIVETVVHLRELGHRVVLCSSGAIGVGLRRMGLKERGKALSQKQVCIPFLRLAPPR